MKYKRMNYQVWNENGWNWKDQNEGMNWKGCKCKGWTKQYEFVGMRSEGMKSTSMTWEVWI